MEEDEKPLAMPEHQRKQLGILLEFAIDEPLELRLLALDYNLNQVCTLPAPAPVSAPAPVPVSCDWF